MPFMNLTMAVCKRESAGIIVVSGRLIHPTCWICAEPTIIDAPWVFIQHNPAIGSSNYNNITLFPEYSVIRIKRRRARLDFIYNRIHISIHGHAADSREISNSGLLRSSPTIHCSRICWTFKGCNVWSVRKYQSQFEQIGICRRRGLLHVAINPLILGVSRSEEHTSELQSP